MSIITLQNISKKLGHTQALNDITLNFKSGEVHVLLGENGAGKSTLVSLLAGLYPPDSGTILFNGQKICLNSPHDSLKLGIGIVFQHPLLVPELTVIENMILGQPWWKLLHYTKALSRFEKLSLMLGVNIDPEKKLANLSLGERQQVEIIRALWYKQQVLVLDEATSLLSQQGIQALGTMIKVFASQGEVNQGGAIIFITHKLNEAIAYADHITILCKGKKVGEIAKQELQSSSKDQLTEKIFTLMFEHKAKTEQYNLSQQKVLTDKLPQKNEILADKSTQLSQKDIIFAVKNIFTPDAKNTCNLKGLSFSLHKGEVLGIAGMDGNGQKHLAEALAGQRHLKSGQIVLKNLDITVMNALERQKIGISYVTDDRLGEGIIATEAISMNILLKKIGLNPFWTFGLTQDKNIVAFSQEKIQEFSISPPNHTTSIEKLSGGNIQKVILARELKNKNNALIIFNKPTHGLDLYTTLEIRSLLMEQAQSGIMHIIISSDLDELLTLCTKIAVIHNGKIIGIVKNDLHAHASITRLLAAS